MTKMMITITMKKMTTPIPITTIITNKIIKIDDDGDKNENKK